MYTIHVFDDFTLEYKVWQNELELWDLNLRLILLTVFIIPYSAKHLKTRNVYLFLKINWFY